MGCPICQESLGSRDMGCTLQTGVGDLLAVEQSLFLCHDGLLYKHSMSNLPADDIITSCDPILVETTSFGISC